MCNRIEVIIISITATCKYLTNINKRNFTDRVQSNFGIIEYEKFPDVFDVNYEQSNKYLFKTRIEYYY